MCWRKPRSLSKFFCIEILSSFTIGFQKILQSKIAAKNEGSSMWDADEIVREHKLSKNRTRVFAHFSQNARAIAARNELIPEYGAYFGPLILTAQSSTYYVTVKSVEWGFKSNTKPTTQQYVASCQKTAKV